MLNDLLFRRGECAEALIFVVQPCQEVQSYKEESLLSVSPSASEPHPSCLTSRSNPPTLHRRPLLFRRQFLLAMLQSRAALHHQCKVERL